MIVGPCQMCHEYTEGLKYLEPGDGGPRLLCFACFDKAKQEAEGPK